jgi:hypothetical protein
LGVERQRHITQKNRITTVPECGNSVYFLQTLRIGRTKRLAGSFLLEEAFFDRDRKESTREFEAYALSEIPVNPLLCGKGILSPAAASIGVPNRPKPEGDLSSRFHSRQGFRF